MPAENFASPSTKWVRSSGCVGESHRVEVAFPASAGASVLLRNSTRPGAVLSFEAQVWQSFVDGIKIGEIAPPSR